MPKHSISPSDGSVIRSDRSAFIGGSDARIIMGDDEPPCSGSGGRNAARSSRRTSPTT